MRPTECTTCSLRAASTCGWRTSIIATPDGRPDRLARRFLHRGSEATSRRRNGLREAHAPGSHSGDLLSAADSARYAMFQHMIANHDWSMRAGPAGEDCCHNTKLIGRRGPGRGDAHSLRLRFFRAGRRALRRRRRRHRHQQRPPARLSRLLRPQWPGASPRRGRCAPREPQILGALASTPGLDATHAAARGRVPRRLLCRHRDRRDVSAKVLKRCIS